MTRAEAGRLGGCKTAQLHGPDHMRAIGRLGARTFWSRYTVRPIGTSDWGIYRRSDGTFLKLMNPRNLPFTK